MMLLIYSFLCCIQYTCFFLLFSLPLPSDPALDTTITIDGKTITVPQGKPKSQPKYSSSSFSQVLHYEATSLH